VGGLASGGVALLAIVAAGAIVRFATIGSQGFWFDELLAVQVITRDPGDMLSRISEAETNPPLYFAVAAVWERIFGADEVALRSLSALAGTATIPVVYLAGRELGSPRAGLIAAALTAASPFTIWYSQEARPYALMLFLAALSFLCFAHLLKGRRGGWTWAWVAVSVLAVWTHYFAGLLVALEAAWLLWRLPAARRELVRPLAALALGCAVVLPLALEQRSLGSWIPVVDLIDRAVQLPPHFVLGMSTPWDPLPPLAVAAAAGALAYGVVRTLSTGGRLPEVAGLITLAGFGIVLVLAVVGADFITSRNLLELWAPLAVAAGALLAVDRLGVAMAGALCVGGLALAIWTAATPEAGRPDWGPLAQALEPGPEGGAIISQSLYAAPMLLHLDEARAAAPGERLTASAVDVVELRPVADRSVGPCWWLAFCGGRDVIGGRPGLPLPVPDGLERFDGGSTDLFEYTRYRAPRPVTLQPAPFGGVYEQAGGS
jgi:hypothetical protein